MPTSAAKLPLRQPSSTMTACRGLGDRCHDGGVVERPQAAQVDHLGLDIVGRQRGRRLQRLPERAAIGDQRNIAAGTANSCFVDINRSGIGGKLAGHVVEHDVLENQNRIGVLQRGPQHTAGILKRRRRQHFDAGDMRVPAFEAVRMLGGKLAPGAGRHPDHQRHAELVSRHVTHCGRGIEYLVERQQAEIHRHQFDDRPHAGHRRADAGAGEPGFRERRIANPLRPEFGEQPVAHRVAAAVAADVLTHQKNALVALDRVAQRLLNRFAVSHLNHFGADAFLLHGVSPIAGTALSA